MKAKIFTFLLAMAMIASLGITAYAEDGNSLDDVLNNSVTSSEGDTPVSNDDKTEGSGTTSSNQSFIDGLNEATDLTQEVDGLSEVTAGIKVVASWIVQVLAYGVTILLAVRVVLDLTYIGLPFTRTILANGATGTSPGGNNMNSGFGGGYGSSFGGGYGSSFGGGYGSSFGGSRFGGIGGQGPQGSAGGIQWISDAALNAVAEGKAQGPNGKISGPFKTYIKDMVAMLILVPVLITLAVTGSLTELGFLIGDVVVGFIASLGAML